MSGVERETGANPASFHGRRVLLTGATGLLGGHLLEALIGRGAEVVCLVRDWVPRARAVEEGWLARATLVRGELEDLGVLVRTLNEHEIDSVFHVGAQTIVGTAQRSPLSTFESNVRGTWNLLEACRLFPRGVGRILLASSDKAYGPQERLPYTEATPLEGRAPYDASKAAADVIAMSYAHTYGLPVAIARCGNLYGPGDLNWNRLVPGTIRSVLEGKFPVIRSDGTLVRDWFHVGDATRAYLALAARFEGGEVAGEVFNFGTGVPHSALEVVRRVLEITGREDLPPTILGEAAGEIPRQFLDCTKARTMLDWAPRRALDEGLRETIAWYRAHLGA